jgi:glyoxylase-like metal-dependent hydrolase (beta-lactamase superfamily II)
MTRTLFARLCAAALLLTGCWIAYTQTQAQPPKLTLSKVKDDLYMIEGDGGNVAMYVTSEGVILVDDKFEQDHETIVAQVKSVTPLPVKYVLSTHHHSDHSGGNAKFLPTAEIISTANARANIVNHVQPGAPADMAAARVTFTEESAVFLGGKEVRARYFGRGHTNGDAVVYFPALRTIHTGDLMAGTTPLIDYPGGGSVVEWIKTLDAAMKWDFDTVIPGHGAATTKAGLLTYRNNIVKLRDRAAGLIREGKSQDDVAKVMIAEFGWGPKSMQMQWSLPGMMAELK